MSMSTRPAQSRAVCLESLSPTRNPGTDLYNYTSGRFLSDELVRLGERKRVFDIRGLYCIVSKTLGCSLDDISSIRKLAEGGFNRVFLITLKDDFKLVARIPYPLLIPKGYAYASEVATMYFLRSKGLPVPEVYGYSFSPENEAKTEYILMEYVEGTDLNTIWFQLDEREIISFMKELAEFEETMMSLQFPAGGSIFYTKDLEKLSGIKGIPIQAGQEEADGVSKFSMGPDVSVPLWFGRRETMDVFRGPYKDAESVLTTGAKKELTYLDQFGSPRQPFDRMHRQYYDHKAQSPLEHVNNLTRYLQLAPYLIPGDDFLTTFCLRHPDLSQNNIKVTRAESGSGLRIHRILDWQHAVVLPLFLNATAPDFIANEADEISRTLRKPVMRQDLDQLSEEDQAIERELHRRRLVHFHYYMHTGAYNQRHWKAIASSNPSVITTFVQSSAPWEGETIQLLNAMLGLVGEWETLSSKSSKPAAECPVSFSEDEQATAEKLRASMDEAEMLWQCVSEFVGGCLRDTWVPTSRYEEAKALAEQLKGISLDQCKSEDEETAKKMIAEIEADWPLSDRPEGETETYM